MNVRDREDRRNAIPAIPTPRELVERMIRVDQAGEFGAVRIYEGQLAALRWTGRGNSDTGRKIAVMARQEREHNKVFDRLLAERRVRPTALSPLWSVAGFALGAATALMGDKAAMACTVAVEETIDEHYADQAAALGDDEAELRTTVEKFRADELDPSRRGAGLGRRADAGLRRAVRRHQDGLATRDLAVDKNLLRTALRLAAALGASSLSSAPARCPSTESRASSRADSRAETRGRSPAAPASSAPTG